MYVHIKDAISPAKLPPLVLSVHVVQYLLWFCIALCYNIPKPPVLGNDGLPICDHLKEIKNKIVHKRFLDHPVGVVFLKSSFQLSQVKGYCFKSRGIYVTESKMVRAKWTMSHRELKTTDTKESSRERKNLQSCCLELLLHCQIIPCC